MVQLASRTAVLKDSGSKIDFGDRGLSRASESLSVRPASWIRCRQLAEANAAVDSQLNSLVRSNLDSLRRLARSYQNREFSFIDNSMFDERGAGSQIFKAELGLSPHGRELGTAPLRNRGVDLPNHLSQLCQAPLLSPAQERMLFQRMNFLLHQASLLSQQLNVTRPSRARLELIGRLILLAQWHRDRIVEANLRLVISIVKKFVNPSNTFDDLLSDGIMGLIRAVEKFDYDRGFRFSTYATQVVRRNSYQTVVASQQERQKLVGGFADIDLETSDEQRASAISEKRWHDLRSRLSIMLQNLDRREKFIIRARFSLGSHRKVHTLQSLADRLGISKERVRQLESRAMEKLRGMAGDARFSELELS